MTPELQDGWTAAEVADLHVSFPEHTAVLPGGKVIAITSRSEFFHLAALYPSCFGDDTGPVEQRCSRTASWGTPEERALRARYPTMF